MHCWHKLKDTLRPRRDREDFIKEMTPELSFTFKQMFTGKELEKGGQVFQKDSQDEHCYRL